MKLVIVIPCYNEEEVLPTSSREIGNLLKGLIAKEKISDDSKILFVDDGSVDRTWELIEALSIQDSLFTGLKFSCNFGYQAAVLAGLTAARKDAYAIISIDADLQDGVSAIEKMVDAYLEGYEVVYGVRNKRDTDTWFKRTTAVGFYKAMNLLGAQVVENHADFRLTSQRATKALLDLPERNLFLRGMVHLVGFKSTNVYYDRKERFAGELKYPLKKMLESTFDGIRSFSVGPFRMNMNIGFLVIFIAIALLVYSIGQTTDGWTSLMVSTWFLGGAHLVCLAVIGESIGKTLQKSNKDQDLLFRLIWMTKSLHTYLLKPLFASGTILVSDTLILNRRRNRA